MYSCVHACKIRHLGANEDQCMNHCDRKSGSGCSPAVNGFQFSLCGSCPTGDSHSGCNGSPTVPECEKGCATYGNYYLFDHFCRRKLLFFSRFRQFIFIISYFNFYQERNQLAINGGLGENGLVALRHAAKREQFKEQEIVYLQNGEETNVRPTFKHKQKSATRIHVQVMSSIKMVSNSHFDSLNPSLRYFLLQASIKYLFFSQL